MSSDEPAAQSTGSAPAPPRPRSTTRIVITWALPLFLVGVLIAFRQVMLPFVLGVLVAYLLAPPVHAIAGLRLGRRRLPTAAGVIVVYIGIAAAIGTFLLGFLPHVSGDFARLLRETPSFLKRVRTEYLPRADAWVEERLEPRPREEAP